MSQLNNHLPIYLDYSATTPVDPRVAQKMIPYLTEHFGNPASRSHAYGWETEQAVEEAREEVAALVHCDPKEIIWTSGATESNNLAIKGAAHFYKGKGKHLVTLMTEHKAVLDTCKTLERTGKAQVTYLRVDPAGRQIEHRFLQPGLQTSGHHDAAACKAVAPARPVLAKPVGFANACRIAKAFHPIPCLRTNRSRPRRGSGRSSPTTEPRSRSGVPAQSRDIS